MTICFGFLEYCLSLIVVNRLAGHIRTHFIPPVGRLGSFDFSISVIICSKALATLVFNRALASVKPQLNSSASFLPSSTGTCRCSDLRSLLLPTMTSGTQSAPFQSRQLWPYTVRRTWVHTRWLRILSLRILIISYDCFDATE